MSAQGARYDKVLKSTVPSELHTAVVAAARDRMMSVTAWVRGTLADALKKDANDEQRRRP